MRVKSVSGIRKKGEKMKAQEIKNILIVKILKLDLEIYDLTEAQFTFNNRSTIALAEQFIFCSRYEGFPEDLKEAYSKDIFVRADCKIKAEALIKEIKKAKK